MDNRIKVFGTAFIDCGAVLKGEFDFKKTEGLKSLAKGDHCVVLWEDPMRAIFRTIKEQDDRSSEELMKEWMASASEILKAVRRNRKQISLINVYEAQEHPEKFSQFCKDHFGIGASIIESQASSWDGVLPIFQKITSVYFRKLQATLQELEVSSVALDSSFETALGVKSPEGLALFHAIDALKKLELANSAKEQLLAAEEQVRAAQGKLEEQRAVLCQKDEELKKAEESALEKHEMLLTELHEAFKESEGYFEQWKKAESERDEALQGASAELEQLRGQLKSKSQVIAEQQALLLQKDDELKSSEEKLLQNYEMLLTELQEAFKESEGYFEQWKKAESTGHGLILKVDAVSRGNAVDHGSHRHLDYALNGVELLGRSWPTLRTRLIRHNGRSGVLFFEAATSPFYAWDPSGEEGGEHFMLFVPSDPTARDYLVSATTSDLLMIKDTVAIILSDLKMNGLPAETVTDWISVSESLLTQIDEIPERLHYDSVQSKLEGPSDSIIEKLILNASFRDRFYPSLRMNWEPDSGKVTIFGGENGRPHFSTWPVDLEGRNRETFELFAPSSSGNGNGNAATPNLTKRDQAFLAVLLGEVPNFLVHAANQHPSASARISSLSRKAKGLRKKALKLKSI